MMAFQIFTKSANVLGLMITLLIAPSATYAQSPLVIEVGNFSVATERDILPPDWKPLTFKKIERHTIYSLVRDQGTLVVKAVAEASASGLIREIQINPKEFPIVQWRWKVNNVLRKGDVHRKEGDDYPARLYITFEYNAGKLSLFERTKYEMVRLFYGQYPPLNAINYIWESHAPKGTMVPNPYTRRVMMVVVESGLEKVNQWVEEERNIYEDYRRAFGEEPPMISGVAIMTDTDNTRETAVAYYGDILLKKMEKRMPGRYFFSSWQSSFFLTFFIRNNKIKLVKFW